MVARPFDRIQAGVEAWSKTTLSPLRFVTFRTIWLASMGANIGSIIQMVGASWHMAEIGVGAEWVALVQTASYAPIVFLALPAGALADTSDKRRVMLWSLFFGIAMAFALIATALIGVLSPSLLLMFTLLLGCSGAAFQPAWQASVGDLLEREHLPAAVSLNALAYNMARSIGPAIGGAIVAASGAVGAFGVNAVGFIGLLVVILLWKARKQDDGLPREPIIRAMSAGIRYALLSPTLSAIYMRAVLFGFSGGGILALLPLVAKEKLGGGPVTFGALLASFGIGSMISALTTAHVRKTMTAQRLVGVATIGVALTSILLAVSTSMLATTSILFLCGASWLWAMTTFGACVQMSCPRWVAGRAVAMGQASAVGGMAAGAAAVGFAAKAYGLEIALFACGGMLLSTLLAARIWRLPEVEGLDFSLSANAVIAPGAQLDPRSARLW